MVAKIVNERQKLQPTAFYSELEVKLADVDRVLAVTAKVKVTSTECVAGEVRVSGKVNYNIIYVSDEGGIESALTSKDFLEKILDKGVTSTTHVLVNAYAEDTEWTGKEILRLRTTIELCGWYLTEMEITAETVNENGVCCYAETVEIENTSILSTAVKEVAKELEIVGGLDKLLSCQAKISVNSVASATEIAYVEGEVIASLMYARDNKIYMDNLSIPFSAEVVGVDIVPESTVVIYPQIASINTTMSGEDGVLVEVTLMLKGVVVKVEELTLLKDAYCLTKELKLNETEYRFGCTCCRESISDKITGSVRLSGAGARAIAVSTQPTISGLTVSVQDKKELLAEGVLNSRIIYLDDYGAPYSTLIEIPFQLVGARDCAMAEVLSANAEVHSFYAKVRLSDEIEFDANITVAVEGLEYMNVRCIEGYEILGDSEDDDAAVSLYIVGENETLFSVAKSLRTDEETILAQNENLTLPLVAGTQIIVYKEL